MNHRPINDVLTESFVLPFNNLEHYAPYNGAIEKSQQEVKRSLREKLLLGLSDCRNHVATYAEVAVIALNHRIRPCLNGRISWQVFFGFTNINLFLRNGKGGEFMIG